MDFDRELALITGGRELNYTENHLKHIKKILRGEQGLFWRLREVGHYLVETHQLASIGIFRCVGDELDDFIFIANDGSKQHNIDAASFHRDTLRTGNARDEAVKIIDSHFKKQRQLMPSSSEQQELIVPIENLQQVVGVMHAEKAAGEKFSEHEIRLLRETAGLIGRLFVPAVVHIQG